jgi:COP9 signalosome, subunit CSN8.
MYSDVQYACSVERALMEGSYGRLRDALARTPHHAYNNIIAAIQLDVAHEIAANCQAAYSDLDVATAMKFLNIADQRLFAEFCKTV